MKRILWLLLPLCFLLTACSPPKGMTEGGMEWNAKAWASVGPLLGVENISGDLIFSETITDYESQGLSYGAWITLEEKTITNAAGEESPTYSAVAFVMVQEACPGNEDGLPEDPQAVVEEWLAAASDYYELGEPVTEAAATQDFALRTITPQPDNPYDHGYYATAVHGNFAISVELMCLPGYYPDAHSMMLRFLRSFHYRDLS